MLAGVVSQPKSASSPPQFGASSESEEALMALKRELDTTKAALVAAKEEAETLLADAALAESEAESLGNTLESQTLQLRAYNAENKALKAELAALRLNSFSKEKALQMGETIKNAIDAAVAKF
jgi:predicted  nucleic acid-binding Zn-ribbon protein